MTIIELIVLIVLISCIVWFGIIAGMEINKEEKYIDKLKAIIIRDEIKEMYIEELCPHCDTETEIPADRPSFCHNCGVEILPCSMCDIDDRCDYTDEERCWKYPRGVHKDG